MRRVIDPATGQPCIRYAPQDRVKVCIDGTQVCGTVVSPLGHRALEMDNGQSVRVEHVPYYRVRLDGQREPIAVHPTAIVKQADTGGMGVVQHLEAF